MKKLRVRFSLLLLGVLVLAVIISIGSVQAAPRNDNDDSLSILDPFTLNLLVMEEEGAPLGWLPIRISDRPALRSPFRPALP